MKKCNKCGKTYDDSWGVCLSDGTQLVGDVDMSLREQNFKASEREAPDVISGKKTRITKNEILGCVGGVIFMNTVKLISNVVGIQLGGIPVGLSFLVGFYLVLRIAKRRFIFGVVTIIAIGFIGLFFYLPTIANTSPKDMGLLTALENRDAPMVKKIISQGVDPNIKILGSPLVFDGIKEGNDYTLRTLIEAGADVNIRSSYGRTPLHEAALYGQVEIVEYLIEKGADVNAKNPRGETPLFYAEDGLKVGPKRTERHVQVAKILREHGGTK